MLRMFAAACAVLDLAGTIASLGVDYDRHGLAWWLLLNALLFLLPIGLRVCEPLLAAMAGDSKRDLDMIATATQFVATEPVGRTRSARQ
jgi:hypothetical protein